MGTAWVCLAGPGRGADHAAEILGPERRVLGAVHLEALTRASVCRRKAHVVEHSAGIKEFGIEAEPAALAGEGRPVIDAARVVEQQWWLGIPDQFGHFTRQTAAGNGDARDWLGDHVDCV